MDEPDHDQALLDSASAIADTYRGEPIDKFVSRAFRPAVARYFRSRNGLRVRRFVAFDLLAVVLMVWQSAVGYALCCPSCVAAQPREITIFNYISIALNVLLFIAQVILWCGQAYTLCSSKTSSEIRPTILNFNSFQRILVIIRGIIQTSVAALISQLYSMCLYEGLGLPPPECLALTLQIVAVAVFLGALSAVEYQFIINLDDIDRVLSRYRKERIPGADAVVEVMPKMPNVFLRRCGFLDRA